MLILLAKEKYSPIDTLSANLINFFSLNKSTVFIAVKYSLEVFEFSKKEQFCNDEFHNITTLGQFVEIFFSISKKIRVSREERLNKRIILFFWNLFVKLD